MKNVKKIISSLLAAVIVLTAAPLSGFVGLKLNFDWLDFSTKSSAEEKELAPTGQCGENVYWTFDKDTGLLTISGSGNMDNYNNESSPFYSCPLIKTVVIENEVTSVGYSAFSGCIGLTSITIPDSVTSIDEDAFSDCTGLKELTMPCSVKYKYTSFSECSNIEKITLTKGTGKMNDYDKISYIYVHVFTPWYISKDNIKEIILEDGITSIGNYAFSGCTGLTSITIPDGVTSIGNYAFSSCTGLTSITIPDSVTSIDKDAFSDCTGLKELTMPCSAEIGSNSFSECSNVEKVTLTKGTGKMNDYDSSRSYTPWYISKDNIKEIILEDGITSIGNYAFSDCTGLTSITIPDDVTSIGSSAFSGCTGLKELTMPCSVKYKYTSFFECSSIEKITLTKGTGKMNDYDSSRFYTPWYISKDNIKEIILEDGITSIGNHAFSDCTGLTSITIPDDVTSIGSSAFSGCTGLTSITIPDGVTSIGDFTFSDCTGLTSITIPDGVTSIGDCAFSDCTGLTSITISDGVTSIGSSAFSGCTGLTSITIPENVTYIGSFALSNCKKIYYNAKNATVSLAFSSELEEIIIANTVETIPDEFVKGCDTLKSITIPSSVVKIGNDAFNHCDNLESVTFMGDNRIEMGSNIFEYCNKLKIHCKDNSFIAAYAEVNNLTYSIIDDDGNPEYDIKNGMILSYTGNNKKLFVSSGTKIGFGAFENNSVITDVELSSIITKIYNKAFANCTNLSKIIIPQSVASIGDNAFEGCDKLTIWCYAGSYAEAYAINHDIPVKYINLQLNENTIKLQTSESVNLRASFNTELSDEIELIWTSDNPSVVTVTSDGRITAVGKGKATITATSSTGLYATCVVNVDTVEQEKPRVNSVKIDDISLNYKKSTTLKPTIKADDGAKYKVEYSTSNAKVATVDRNGKVTATKRGSGTATITCTVTDSNGNVVKDTCKVNVSLTWWQWIITIVLFGWIWY